MLGLNFYSVWPCLVCMGLVFAIASSPLFAQADYAPSATPNRYRAIDGLRGFLALAVVFHHVATYHQFSSTGAWTTPSTRFYANLGPIGVSMFFMVTGFLFWSKMIDVHGRPRWLSFFIGRIFRIGPLYIFAVFIMLAAVAIATHVHLNVRPSQLASEIGHWLALGTMKQVDVNGYPRTFTLVAGVMWSLAYEWKFYIALLVLALATRREDVHLPFASVALAVCLIPLTIDYSAKWPPDRLTIASLFLCGMLPASLLAKGYLLRISDQFKSSAIIVLILTACCLPPSFVIGHVLCTGLAFYLVTTGGTVFGVLTSRGARRLGDISYGIYLLQGLVLAAVFRPEALRLLSLSAPVAHWMLGLASVILLVGVSAVCHKYIERPGISIGKRIAGHFEKELAVIRR